MQAQIMLKVGAELGFAPSSRTHVPVSPTAETIRLAGRSPAQLTAPTPRSLMPHTLLAR